jgi:hypothetical protein
VSWLWCGLGFDPNRVHVASVVKKVALGQVFPAEYFGIPLSVPFHQRSILIHHRRYIHVILVSDSVVKYHTQKPSKAYHEVPHTHSVES